MPILGVVASQISGHLVAPYSPTGSYDALATLNPTASTSTFSFTGIPQSGYQHLQIRAIARTGVNGNSTNINMRLNNDTSSNFVMHYINAVGSGTPTAGY